MWRNGLVFEGGLQRGSIGDLPIVILDFDGGVDTDLSQEVGHFGWGESRSQARGESGEQVGFVVAGGLGHGLGQPRGDVGVGIGADPVSKEK